MNVKRKIVLLGDGGVGKTSLIRRFVLNSFDDKYLVTIGTKVSKKVMNVTHPTRQADVELTLAIWDIMGHLGVTKVHADYLMGAKGALVVADVSRRSTLDGTLKWVAAVREGNPGVPIVLLANKADLIGQEEMGVNLWEFAEPELDEFALKNDFPCFLTSAKKGDNVELAFTRLSELMLAQADPPASGGAPPSPEG